MTKGNIVPIPHVPKTDFVTRLGVSVGRNGPAVITGKSTGKK